MNWRPNEQPRNYKERWFFENTKKKILTNCYQTNQKKEIEIPRQ